MTNEWPLTMTPAQRLALGEVIFKYLEVVNDYDGRLYPEQQPVPGSLAYPEINEYDGALAGAWSDEPVRLAFGTAQLHMSNASDHLFGLGVLLRTNTEDAVMTVARGAVEACARAHWLLDAGIDGRKRVARTMTERLARLDEMITRYRLFEPEGAHWAEARAEAIALSAQQHAIAVSRSRERRWVGDHPYPGATRAVQLLLAHFGESFGLKAYSDLSAPAHSVLAAFAQRLPRIATEADQRRRTRSPASDEARMVASAVSIGTAAYDTSVRAYFTMFGWQQGPWDSFVREAQRRMREVLGVPRGGIDIVRVRRP